MTTAAITGGHPIPEQVVLLGRHCKVITFQPSHVDDLWKFVKDHPDVFAYLPSGPFDDVESLRETLVSVNNTEHNYTLSILCLETNEVVGCFSYLNVRVPMGVLEIGYIIYSPVMQRTCIGTEAMFLIINNAVETLHFRRIEWKCNAANDKSRNAALRYGFQYEGVFRNHMIVRGKNRDTWWAAILDSEWKQLKNKFESWLDPSNFTENGQQVKSLGILVRTDIPQAE